MPHFGDLIDHKLFARAQAVFGNLCRDAQDGLVLVMVGPTQAGKSVAFNQIYEAMQSDTKGAPAALMPMIRVQLESVGEGRVKTKWLCLHFLKVLKHPVYMHIGDLDELEHYIPSRGRDEGSLRTAVRAAMVARQTSRVLLDEAHLLTRTKSSELRGSLLESLKSIAAIERTLIACGGYELAYRGLFDSAHFAGRTVVFDFGHYQNVPDDLDEWIKILRQYSQRLPLENESLLVDRADALLIASNGVIGLLAKWLWTCKVEAESAGRPLDLGMLKRYAPKVLEQQSIAEDIWHGRKALDATSVVKPGPRKCRKHEEAVELTNDAPPTRRRRPFEARPRRAMIGGIEVWSNG